jgi:trimeric autotransporter adhesin
MANAKFVKTAAAVALGTSVVATAVAPSASAATTYKIKSGKLVNAKTGKVIKGYKTYKSVLYKDGKKYTGLRSGKYYKAGVLATGTYKGVKYKKGAKFTGVSTNGKFYKNGVLGTGTYKNVKYKKGVEFTGVSTNGKYYENGVVATGVKTVDGVVYVDGVKDEVAPVITAEDQTVAYEAKDVDVLAFAKVEDNSKEEIKVTATITFDGKEVPAIDTTKSGEYTVTYAAQDTNGNKAEEKVIKVTVEETTEAVVKSVEALNSTTLKVTFTKALDEAEAKKAAIKLNGKALAAGTLSEDGKTLTIVDSSINKSVDATLEIPAIKLKDAKTDKDVTTKYVSLFSYEDTVAPTVVGATSSIATISETTTNKVVVKFSEPVSSNAIAYVNGTNVTVSQGENKDELELTLGTAAKAGDALAIKLTNVKDLVGNTIEPNPAEVSTVVQAAETSAPVVTNVATKGLEVTFTYNEEVTPATVDAAKTYVSANGVKVAELTAAKLSDDKKSVTYTVNFTDTTAKAAYEKDGVFAGTLYIQDGLVADLAGNKSVASTQSLSLAADKVAPTLVTSEVKDGNLVLTFSEEVTAVEGKTVSFAKYNAVTGNTAAATFETPVVSEKDAKVVTVKLPAASTEEDTTYKVNYAKGTFTDAAKNEADAYASTVTVAKAAKEDAKDTVAPKADLSETTATLKDGNYVLTYKVADTAKANSDETNSALDFASILNKSNYTLAGKALPAEAEIVTSSTDVKDTATTVTITIPKSAVKENLKGELTVTGLKDVTGNTSNAIETSAVLELKEGVAPELTSAVLNADKSITIAFSEELTLVNKDIVVTADDKAVEGTIAAGVGAEAGKYVFTATDKAAIENAKTLTVSTADTTETKDGADNFLVAKKVITLK